MPLRSTEATPGSGLSLLHGIPTSSLLWRHVQPRLGRHGRTIQAVAIPVHLIWRSDDPFRPLSYGRRLAHALSNAELTVVQG